MSNLIKPTTLLGIKRLAKTIKQEQSIPHTRALDIAANHAGYENYAHARHSLSTHSILDRSIHREVTISVMWREKETRQMGNEILTVSLVSLDLTKLKADHFQANRGLRDFRMIEETKMHYLGYIKDSQWNAQDKACAAARSLMFMDATGLMPSGAYSRININTGLPGADHQQVWYDQISKRYLVTDEPYESSVHHKEQKRKEWAERNDVSLIKANWPGMYYPDGGARLYLLSHKEKGIPLAEIMTRINTLPTPPVYDHWTGRSELLN